VVVAVDAEQVGIADGTGCGRVGHRASWSDEGTVAILPAR
jgi:hypothetical protein